MPMFRVELHRPSVRYGERDPNPFLRDIWNIPPRPVTVRSWEIEAKDEAEVRAYLDEAYKQKLPNVQGFTLRLIERIEPTVSMEGAVDG